MFSLIMIDYPLSFISVSTWNYFWWSSRRDYSENVLLFGFCLMLKSWGGPLGLWGAWQLTVVWLKLICSQIKFCHGIACSFMGKRLRACVWTNRQMNKDKDFLRSLRRDKSIGHVWGFIFHCFLILLLNTKIHKFLTRWSFTFYVGE